ncbi:hypothetical protein AG1IA_01827 [Rhizoctonia solani AG-1 IA]|uniref:Uncharacterized protein n=1 Tax=Thanatephorus cucumeris (strain AG1-IA) TaxID=983506 RepID=L8X1P2_THACA|nr:hypothetical protein AG1IA_01827 [Rhizoctonia solani AG-1 IA]
MQSTLGIIPLARRVWRYSLVGRVIGLLNGHLLQEPTRRPSRLPSASSRIRIGYRQLHGRDGEAYRAIPDTFLGSLGKTRFYRKGYEKILLQVEEDQMKGRRYDAVLGAQDSLCSVLAAITALFVIYGLDSLDSKLDGPLYGFGVPRRRLWSSSSFHLFFCVGDGLEIYVILAPGRAPGELSNVAGLSEVTAETAAGERVFVIRRELKKD